MAQLLVTAAVTIAMSSDRPQVVSAIDGRRVLHVACGGHHTLAVCEHDPRDHARRSVPHPSHHSIHPSPSAQAITNPPASARALQSTGTSGHHPHGLGYLVSSQQQPSVHASYPGPGGAPPFPLPASSTLRESAAASTVASWLGTFAGVVEKEKDKGSSKSNTGPLPNHVAGGASTWNGSDERNSRVSRVLVTVGAVCLVRWFRRLAGRSCRGHVLALHRVSWGVWCVGSLPA